MKNKIQTQVIGGKFKNLKLDLPSLEVTRSTKSILKESLFNSIAFDVVGQNFVEVFGGSGSIMIEAVSRGALKGYAIELDKNSFRVLEQNCKKADSSLFKCKRGDSFLLLKELVNELKQEAILYFDPPFEFRDNMQNIYQKCFDLLASLDKSKIQMAIFEHYSALKVPDSIGAFKLKKTKKFGKSSLSYYYHD